MIASELKKLARDIDKIDPTNHALIAICSVLSAIVEHLYLWQVEKEQK